jgi:hypothetical protein
MSAARRRPPAPARALACLLWLALARGALGGLQPELKLDTSGRAVRTVSYTEGKPPLALTANLTLSAAGSPCVTAVVRFPCPRGCTLPLREPNADAPRAGAHHQPGERAAGDAGDFGRLQSGLQSDTTSRAVV